MIHTILISDNQLKLISKLYHNIKKTQFTKQELEELEIVCGVMEDIVNRESYLGDISEDMIHEIAEY